MKFKAGPGFLVTAAFIGPGTVFTASMAGAQYGYALMWAVIFAVFAAYVLQDMAARLALITQRGLAENIIYQTDNRVIRYALLALTFTAIILGNAAYEGGNIAGASLALSDLSAIESVPLWATLISVLAGLILFTSRQKRLEQVLLWLVVLMAFAFVSTWFVVEADWFSVLGSMFHWQIPSGALLTTLALVGTTVVPYNLFLYASAVKSHWQGAEQLPAAKRDLMVALPIGGLITLAVLGAAGTAFFGKAMALNSVSDLAPAMAPIFGEWSRILLGVGLFAAGLSSAITAPLAAAIVVNELFGGKWSLTDTPFRLSWGVILILGLTANLLAFKPTSIIFVAQVANGLLLPLLAGFLLFALNKHRHSIANNWRHNVLGAIILVIVSSLSYRTLLLAFGG